MNLISKTYCYKETIARPLGIRRQKRMTTQNYMRHENENVCCFQQRCGFVAKFKSGYKENNRMEILELGEEIRKWFVMDMVEIFKRKNNA